MSATLLRIAGGRVIDPASAHDGLHDLWIAEGRVVAVGAAPPGATPARTLDATGCWVLPGLVDLCARLREPGAAEQADIASETAAAVRGGVTTVCCPPDTDPVIDGPSVVDRIRGRAAEAGLCRVHCVGALTRGLEGRVLAEMAALAAAGCVGVGQARAPVTDTGVLRRAFEYAAGLGLTVFLQPEDPWLAGRGTVHEGPVGTRLGLVGIPETAETVAIARDLLLIGQTGVRAHFGRLSSAQAVGMVAAARRRGLRVSADVGVHHLHLTDQAVEGYDANRHLRPPLRSRRDLLALRRGLARGVIEVICSDHEPHDADAKSAPFDQTQPGASALEVLLPLAMALVAEEALDLATVVAALTCRPAAVLGLPVGTLAPGAPADVCIYEPTTRWTVSTDALVSAGRNCAFLGQTLTGAVRATLVGGRVVHGEA